MCETLQVIAVPAFEDNYIWLLHNSSQAVVVDPGDEVPVLNALKLHGLNLHAMLITHRHHDHIDGVNGLLKHFPDAKIFAPIFPFNFAYITANESSQITLTLGENHKLHFKVLDVPGHTLDHIAYVLNVAEETWLFCGDTLFGAGCGRLFEGTPAQMLASLKKISALPTTTKVFCTHEYTLTNIQFARSLDAENVALKIREAETILLREKNIPSLPSTIQLELATNPFLRCDTQAIKNAMHLENATELEVFSKVRALRNQF
jgi:hydroxyacylglutathione hydrolase